MKFINDKEIYVILIFSLLTAVSVKSLLAQILPYKDSNLVVEERVKDLMKRMTVEEKVNQMLKLNLADLKQGEKGNVTQESLEDIRLKDTIIISKK